jgi:hypothetical protein
MRRRIPSHTGIPTNVHNSPTHSIPMQVKSLKQIATALSMSLLPVVNVFLILFLLMSICEFSAAVKLAMLLQKGVLKKGV